MPSIWFTLLLGIATALAIKVVYLIRLKKIKLKPNCLLTKHPLVVISSYSPHKLFIDIKAADFLRAHGYEVFKIELCTRFDKVSAHQLKKKMRIAEMNLKQFHLIYGPEHQFAVGSIRHLYPSAIRSELQFEKQSNEDVLQLAISLAEKDFKCSH